MEIKKLHQIDERARRGNTMHLRVKLARKFLNISQKEMAEFLDVTQPYLSKIENGDNSVPTMYLQLLAVNGIDSYWLLTGETIGGEEVFEFDSTERGTERRSAMSNIEKKLCKLSNEQLNALSTIISTMGVR
ncbi:helix-turn-helix transcriptional regulator [Veillonella sp.]|uniref:helix-turn-helix domain-containing protein n=1 Tax=Veillonella sp. TaxID=1926307 RepID=UPI0025F69F59|nr:helix-turn-helix transcriptional regulator [Veillonella sp.]